MQAATRFLLGISLVAVSACATARPPATIGGNASSNATGATHVRVENHNFSDMNIYILRSGGERLRLGTATGNSTTTLLIPAYLVSTPTTLRFLADPIGSRVEPVSDEITVSPGDTLELEIPA